MILLFSLLALNVLKNHEPAFCSLNEGKAEVWELGSDGTSKRVLFHLSEPVGYDVFKLYSTRKYVGISFNSEEGASTLLRIYDRRTGTALLSATCDRSLSFRWIEGKTLAIMSGDSIKIVPTISTISLDLYLMFSTDGGGGIEWYQKALFPDYCDDLLKRLDKRFSAPIARDSAGGFDPNYVTLLDNGLAAICVYDNKLRRNIFKVIRKSNLSEVFTVSEVSQALVYSTGKVIVFWSEHDLGKVRVFDQIGNQVSEFYAIAAG